MRHINKRHPKRIFIRGISNPKLRRKAFYLVIGPSRLKTHTDCPREFFVWNEARHRVKYLEWRQRSFHYKPHHRMWDVIRWDNNTQNTMRHK